jgi:hypothetical protein
MDGTQVLSRTTWMKFSNGGIFTYGDSLLGQLNPTSPRANNCGNSDYDIRHLFSADYVLAPKFHFQNRFLVGAIGGWEWSGKIFARSGLPFSSFQSGTYALGAPRQFEFGLKIDF